LLHFVRNDVLSVCIIASLPVAASVSDDVLGVFVRYYINNNLDGKMILLPLHALVCKNKEAVSKVN